MFVDASVTGRLLVPAVVALVLGLLRRYLPARKTDPQAQLDSDGNVEDFTYANTAVYTAMIVIGIGVAFISHKGLAAANRDFADADGTAVFHLLASDYLWWFFPGFGALCWSWEITLFLWSLFVGRAKVNRYIDWTNERAGYNSTRALRLIGILITLPVGLATLLAIPIHSTLSDSEIVVGHFASLHRERLPYAQARHLALVNGFRDRYGKFGARAEVIVDFAGGKSWNSADNRDFTPQPDPGLAEFLQQKTGLPLERAETEADLPKAGR
jgi:hypothetical protein